MYTTFTNLHRKLLGVFFIVTVFSQGTGTAQSMPSTEIQQPKQQDTDAASVTRQSDVEFLTGLSQVIERDKIRLENLKRDSSRMAPVFREKSAQFYQVDNQLDSARNTTMAPEALATLEHRWQQLKSNLDFMLEHRRSMHQQIRILERKVEKEQEAMDFLMKGDMANMLEITEQGEPRQKDIVNRLPSDSASISDTLAWENTVNRYQTAQNEYNWRIVEAERELALRKAEFEIAKNKWLLVEQLLALNLDDLTIARSLRESVQHQLAQWKETLQSLEEELPMLQKSGDTVRLQEVMQERMNETRSLTHQVESMLAANATLINTLEARIGRMSALQEMLTKDISQATRRIESQIRRLEFLRSPLAPHRIYSFLINTGPRILLIILLLFLIWLGGRWLTHRILRGVIRYKSKEEREERIDTLSRAIRSGLTVIVLFGGFLAVLSELGINVSVLLGGAAVFSLAIAFGAQSLVKDYFSGFMILTENQYRVGNVIKINNISGVVEDISLRSTILRDLEGVAHFIPHSEITVVSNLTHGWSRVSLDIGVAYKENVDRVMEVIMEVAEGMREEPEFKHLITGAPEMLGVDAFADSAVVIKVLVKTRPLKQWVIKRELLRRLKNRFDEVGIEIPFPHRTIYYGNAQEPGPDRKNNKKTDKSLKQDVSTD